MQNVLIKYYETGSVVKFWGDGKYGNCARCKEYKKLDRHHVRTKSRHGDKLVGVCRECNQWIGEHIEEATKLGLDMTRYGNVESDKTRSNAKRRSFN